MRTTIPAGRHLLGSYLVWDSGLPSVRLLIFAYLCSSLLIFVLLANWALLGPMVSVSTGMEPKESDRMEYEVLVFLANMARTNVSGNLQWLSERQAVTWLYSLVGIYFGVSFYFPSYF
jgi:hypothetical protein